MDTRKEVSKEAVRVRLTSPCRVMLEMRLRTTACSASFSSPSASYTRR